MIEEIQLSNELINHVIPYDKQLIESSSRIIKFDDSGTLHVIDYDSEGKKTKDIPLLQRDIKKVEEIEDIQGSINNMKFKSNRHKVKFYIYTLILLIMFIASILIIKLI